MTSNISLDTTNTYISQIEDGTSCVTSDFDTTTCSAKDTDTSITAYLSRPVFDSPLIHTNLDFYHDFDIASGVALSAPSGTASLTQPVFHPTTLSFDYPEHTITLSSTDSELDHDYIDHCTAYSHLTQASSSQQQALDESISCLTAASFT
jgi:hypothetical protein